MSVSARTMDSCDGSRHGKNGEQLHCITWNNTGWHTYSHTHTRWLGFCFVRHNRNFLRRRCRATATAQARLMVILHLTTVLNDIINYTCVPCLSTLPSCRDECTANAFTRAFFWMDDRCTLARLDGIHRHIGSHVMQHIAYTNHRNKKTHIHTHTYRRQWTRPEKSISRTWLGNSCHACGGRLVKPGRIVLIGQTMYYSNRWRGSFVRDLRCDRVIYDQDTRTWAVREH